MSWHLAIHGDCILAKPGPDAWLATKIAATAVNDWETRDAEWFGGRIRPQKVAAHLHDMDEFSATSGHELIAWSVKERRVQLRALLSEGNLPDWMGTIVAVCRAAGSLGATGKILFFGLAQPIAFELALGRKKATWRALDRREALLAGEPRMVGEVERLSKARTGGGAGPAAAAATEAELAMEVYRRLDGSEARVARFLEALEHLRARGG